MQIVLEHIQEVLGQCLLLVEGRRTDGEIHDKARIHSVNYSGTEVPGTGAHMVRFINSAPYLKTS